LAQLGVALVILVGAPRPSLGGGTNCKQARGFMRLTKLVRLTRPGGVLGLVRLVLWS
jgi:hypothetical protein